MRKQRMPTHEQDDDDGARSGDMKMHKSVMKGICLLFK